MQMKLDTIKSYKNVVGRERERERERDGEYGRNIFMYFWKIA